MTADTLARHDGIKWKAHATVEKWDGDQVAYVTEKTGVLAPSGSLLAAHLAPAEVVESPGNLLTTAGLTRLTALLIASGSPQALTNTSVRLGVGNGSTAAAIGDTDLAAASGSGNRYFMTMDATFPSVAAGVLTAKATFGASDGNFVWAEWCIDIGAPTVSAGTTVNACMFNRKVAALGTKANPAVWALTATITIS
jgi:hypothetical protein